MSQYEIFYLVGAVAAFGIFAVTLVMARVTSGSRPGSK